MKLTSSFRFSILVMAILALALASPAQAKKPTHMAAAAAAPSAPVSPKETPSGTVASGDVVISHMSAESSHGYIDVFLSIKNNGKSDERLIGAGSTWEAGDVVQVKKDKKGKEQETPVAVDIPSDKTVDLSSGTTWLRVKNVTAEPKGAKVFPLTLYFRHSPNAALKIAMNGGGKGLIRSIDKWFSK